MFLILFVTLGMSFLLMGLMVAGRAMDQAHEQRNKHMAWIDQGFEQLRLGVDHCVFSYHSNPSGNTHCSEGVSPGQDMMPCLINNGHTFSPYPTTGDPLSDQAQWRVTPANADGRTQIVLGITAQAPEPLRGALEQKDAQWRSTSERCDCPATLPSDFPQACCAVYSMEPNLQMRYIRDDNLYEWDSPALSSAQQADLEDLVDMAEEINEMDRPRRIRIAFRARRDLQQALEEGSRRDAIIRIQLRALNTETDEVKVRDEHVAHFPGSFEHDHNANGQPFYGGSRNEYTYESGVIEGVFMPGENYQLQATLEEEGSSITIESFNESTHSNLNNGRLEIGNVELEVLHAEIQKY